MNLISCDNCGVVLDQNKLRFPKSIYLADGSIDNGKAMWDEEWYVPYVGCPVCKSKVPKRDKWPEHDAA